MTAIEASSGTYRSRVDGTIVLSVEIEPRYAQAALALFRMPGTPMALAALKAPKPEETTHKPIARWLAIRCGEQEFQRWSVSRGAKAATDSGAADWCRSVCKVTSRGLIDGNHEAEELFKTQIQGPWREFNTEVSR